MILPLEQQVCSLESAKRLKGLGFRQESLYFWIHIMESKTVMESKTDVWSLLPHDWRHVKESGISAYTVAELGEMLPISVKDLFHLTIKRSSKEWMLWYTSYAEHLHSAIETTEAECRAKMLIYLVEHKLMEVLCPKN